MRYVVVVLFAGTFVAGCGSAPSPAGVQKKPQIDTAALAFENPFNGTLTYRDHDVALRSVLFAPGPVPAGSEMRQGWLLMFSTEEGACAKLLHAPAPPAALEARLWLNEQREGSFAFLDPHPGRDEENAIGWVQAGDETSASVLSSGVLNLHYIGDGPRLLRGDIYTAIFDTHAVAVEGRWAGDFTAAYCPQLEGLAAPEEP